MPNTPMGSWRNPPLAYVVAEVKLSPFYKLESHVGDFQAAVRDRFPRTKEGNVVRFEVQGNAPIVQHEKVWRFFSENQRLGIDVSPRTLGLHATEYEDFPVFAEQLAFILNSAERTIPGMFVDSLGLRFIDYLLPKPGESSLDYLVESVRGFLPPRAHRIREAYWIANFEFEKGTVSLRIIPMLAAGQAHPPNFGPIEVAPAQTQLEAIRRVQSNEQVGCIDTDRLMPVEKKFHAPELIGLFNAMHDDAFETFKATMSKKAESEWV